MKTKIVSCHTADSKLVKQDVNGTVILPPLVFPALTHWEVVRLKYTYVIDKYKHSRLFQTSQTGRQRYSDTSPLSIPWQKLSIKNVSQVT
jgi:hypothetical protein